MINKLMKGLVDLIYGTQRTRREYLNQNPDDTVLAADGCKGTVKAEDGDIKRGIDWVTSQRAVIVLTKTKIVCGKWTIPLDEIASAEINKINSMFGSGQVLKVSTKDAKHYQFGMQLNPEWMNQDSLPLTLESGTVKYSLFSIIIRLALVGYILYWLYERFIQS